MKDLNSRTDTAKLKPQGTSTIGRKDQLEYLAKLFDLEVQFTDFPKVGMKTPIILSSSCNLQRDVLVSPQKRPTYVSWIWF